MKRLHATAEMADGSVLKADTTTKDYILYETTGKRQKPPWGGISENPARWEAFISWSAFRRTGQYAGSFDAFLDDVEMVEAAGETEVDPTPSDPGDD